MPLLPTFLSIILIGVVLCDVNLTGCYGDPFSQMVMCTPKMEELETKLTIMKFLIPDDSIRAELKKICDETMKCLDPLKCSEAQKARDVLETGCTNWQLANGEFVPCIKNAYAAIYNQKYPCSKDHDYLAKDYSTRRNAFTFGATCFQEIVKNECSNAVHELWKNESNYQKVVDVLTVNPNRTSCQSLYDYAEGFECEPMGYDIRERTLRLNFRTIKRDDKELVDLVNLCRSTKECIKSKCVFQEEQLINTEKGCRMIELAGTDFFQCVQKLSNEKPEGLTMLECFKEHDLNTKNKTAKCGFFGEHKECLKVAMKAFCGDGALDGFDENASLLRSTFKCED